MQGAFVNYYSIMPFYKILHNVERVIERVCVRERERVREDGYWESYKEMKKRR